MQEELKYSIKDFQYFMTWYHAYFVWFEQDVFGDIQGRGCLKARGQSVRCIKYIQK